MLPSPGGTGADVGGSASSPHKSELPCSTGPLPRPHFNGGSKVLRMNDVSRHIEPARLRLRSRVRRENESLGVAFLRALVR